MQRPTATTELGTVRGSAQGGLRRFQGIPYAAPPVGALRWRAPMPAQSWSGVRDAVAPGPGCLQVGALQTAPGARFSEDCLYLNVLTPDEPAPAHPWPVMVWIHGGAFVNGTGSDYDARRLVETGRVMVVTINSRLGAFGFFAYPGLEGAGVFGLQDQQAALAWVRRNAAAFGGDPHNITLFGESAGGMSTCAQLASPLARTLFDKAIVQSGSCFLRWDRNMMQPGSPGYRPFAPLAEIEARGVGVAQALGCGAGADALDCLRAVPAADLAAHWPSVQIPYGAALLPEDPVRAFEEGRFARVPILWGGTQDEHRAYVSFWSSPDAVTDANYAELLTETFGDRASQVIERYPIGADGPAGAWAAVATDSSWSCPTLKSFEAAAKHTVVYAYDFADEDAPNPAFNLPAGFRYKAGHASELAYLFELGGRRAAFSDDQVKLADTMVRYWTQFAATGDPNAPGSPAWSRFSDASASVLALTTGLEGVAPFDFAARHHCQLWNAVERASP